MLTLKCSTDETILLHLNPKSKAGKPAKIQPGSVVWTPTSGPGTLEPSADGLTCKYISPDVLDKIDLDNDIFHGSVNADGDAGDGVEPIEDSFIITVSDPNAAALGLSADEPAEKPNIQPLKR